MKRYDIAMDFISKFVDRNENIRKITVKPTFISINGEDVNVSNLHYSMEQAQIGLVIFHYKYIVISNVDASLVSLFFHSNGVVEEFVEIDGWRFRLSEPKTALNRTDTNISCYMSNGELKLSVETNTWKIDSEFKRIWQLFSIVRTCTTQKEIDFAYKIFKNEEEILSLKNKNLQDEVKIDALNTLIHAHEALLEKIKEMVDVKSE